MMKRALALAAILAVCVAWMISAPARNNGAPDALTPDGGYYFGKLVNAKLHGKGRIEWENGARYEGEFAAGLYSGHGQGVMYLPNGDVYRGGFANGLREGEGTLTYAKALPDGRTQERGIWRYGELEDTAREKLALANTETALYNQRALLDKALSAIDARDPGKINLYMLSVAGDGTQEVFRREVDYVGDLFARQFGTKGRALALVNSRTTVAAQPMATVTSIREALQGIAKRMDRQKDILFLFITSHGSKEHEISLNQEKMKLRGLPARDLGQMIKETGITWKVILISACYSGGFIDALKDNHTLVITAARRDRTSFGCADENDFTYFGRAFFKESLPASTSFQDAFHRAEKLVREWERKDLSANGRAGEEEHSLPQMFNPAPAEKYLRLWWAQGQASARATGR
ncbi:MAG: C13 family peptidase [Burkholderiales bacterium]